MITKCCSECNEEKALEDFVVSKDRKDGRTNQCLLCRRAYEKRYRNSSNFKTITRQKIIRNAQLKKLYGISYLEYENRYNKQKGLCAICAKDILLLGNQKTQSKVARIRHPGTQPTGAVHQRAGAAGSGPRRIICRIGHH